MTKHDDLIAALETVNAVSKLDREIIENVIRELRAENEALRSGAVCAAVKPLEWPDQDDLNGMCSVCGNYWAFASGSWRPSEESYRNVTGAKSLEAARAAANEHHINRILSALTIRSEAEVRAEAVAATWAAAIEATAQVADHYADADYCAMGYPEDCGIAASGTADQIRREICSLTPPADISAALDAIKDAAWKAGAEAMRANVMKLPKRNEPIGGQCHTYVRCEEISLLPIPERTK